ncbi:MAG: M56 family metallopeptidase, partial [Acidobacteriales bacterium]|nr:M56 family metallopeptidase [Terriglobales bacterium]
MTAGLLDHLWQSSLFAGGIALLTLFLRKNGAAVRFWLWFAASLKFLVPFAVLAALGDYLSRQFPASLPPTLLAIRPAAEKLSAPGKLLVAPHAEGVAVAPLLAGLWLLGFAAILGLRLLRWLRLRAVLAAAQDVPASLPVRIKTSRSLLEPGLVGIVKPVVLLPSGLMAQLSQAERDSILAHEISHFRRRDNVTAAIHMMVEALFWFHPLVWLIGARLIVERERACDETVLAHGHDPEVYAGGILKVCKFCVQSPLACASGASGADLKNRVRQIMSAESAMDLGAFQRLLLAGATVMALALPVMGGFRDTPLTATVKQVIAVKARAEQAVTTVAAEIGIAPTPRVAKRAPRLKVRAAAMPLQALANASPESAPVPPPAPSAVPDPIVIVPTNASAKAEVVAQPATREV